MTDTFWLAVTAIASIVLAMATIVLTLATIAGAILITWQLYLARVAERNRRDEFYATLDRTYFEIQKLIIQMPCFSNPQLIQTHEQATQYDAFAFITWNFIESIYDYCQQNKALLKTWKCIFLYESRLHRKWFDRLEN